MLQAQIHYIGKKIILTFQKACIIAANVSHSYEIYALIDRHFKYLFCIYLLSFVTHFNKTELLPALFYWIAAIFNWKLAQCSESNGSKRSFKYRYILKAENPLWIQVCSVCVSSLFKIRWVYSSKYMQDAKNLLYMQVCAGCRKPTLDASISRMRKIYFRGKYKQDEENLL